MAVMGFSALLSVLFFMLAGKTAAIILICILFAADFLLGILHAYKACRFLLLITAAAVCAALSFFWHVTAVVAPSAKLLGQTVRLEGTVGALPEGYESENSILLENCVINNTETKLNVMLSSGDPLDARIGDTVLAEHADIFAFASDNEFYYHALSEGCWLRAYTYSLSVTGRNTDLTYKIRRFSHSVCMRLFSALGLEDGSIAAALLLGKSNALSALFRKELRICGASHLFAVSGMHLSLWASLLFFILRKRGRSRWLPNLITILFVLFYIVITGFSPSVMRAGVMMTVLLIGRIIRRQSDPVNSLGIAALLLLSANIYLAGNISFLLSFTAMLGILIVFPSFRMERNQDDAAPKRAGKKIADVLTVSLCVLLTTVPVSAFFFGSVSLLSPVSSLLCTLPVAFVILSAFFGLCFGYIPFLSKLIFFLCGCGCKTISACVERLSRFDFCVCPVKMRDIMIWYTATAVLLLIVYFCFGRKKQKVILALLGCVSVLLAVQSVRALAGIGKAEIHIAAAGNETCVCVTSGNGAYSILIGVGSEYDTVRNVIDYFSSKGITTPDTLILPRDSAAEAGNLKYFLTPPPELICSAGTPALLKNTDHVQYADSFTLDLPQGFTYENSTTALFSAGLLETGALKIVFSFYPGGDFQNVPKAFTEGDYLICRGGIPKNADPEKYGTVIVLSDKTAAQLQLPAGAVTSAELDDLTIKTSVS